VGNHTGLRLNVGCGSTIVAGWLNIDKSPNVILDRFRPLKRLLFRAGVLEEAHLAEWSRNVIWHDARHRFPYPDGGAEAIYSSHMLEHLYLDEAKQVLVEFRRLLQPRGVLRLALPDAAMWASELLAGLERSQNGQVGLQFNEALNTQPTRRPNALKLAVGALGNSRHRWQPTQDLVRAMILNAGFAFCEERAFRQGNLPDLDKVENRPQSMFIEAT